LQPSTRQAASGFLLEILAMSLPPWAQIADELQTVIGPALIASLVMMLVVRCIPAAFALAFRSQIRLSLTLKRLGEQLTPVAAALAVTAGFIAGNDNQKGALEWQRDKDRPFSADDARTVLRWSLESVPPAENYENPPSKWLSRHWLAWTAGLALVVELVVGLPLVPSSLAVIARTLVAVFAARLLTPESLRAESPAVPWLLAVAIVLNWTVLRR